MLALKRVNNYSISMNITLQNRRKKMRFDLIKWFHASIAVLVMMGASVMFAKADLSDPTLSVYYGFDGEGETVKGRINQW